MPSLTADVSVKVAPLVLETAFRHFIANKSVDDVKAKDEFLYHEAFNIVKAFMQTSTKHTVEDLQEFSNTRIPVPPWIHAPRVIVPMSCCEAAARHLIDVLGGSELCQRLVGGTKWWQVRGVPGVDCQWIAARKDWEEAKRKRKEYESQHKRPPAADPNVVHEYTPEMDQMRCLLYAHGGGYFFGSIDQERYCMQRYARKMKGRVFAVGYRLAPQYPFPCALQDALAAYLYLIEPPPDAKHLPVPPSMIMVGGSSAGGGLMIALLQVIRDAGLPMPAGAVLISPWSDLTHSFDSIHENTATDIIPSTGLSFLKPSALWPPPDEESRREVRSRLKDRLRKFVRADSSLPGTPNASRLHLHEPARSVRELRNAQSATELHISSDDKQKAAGNAPSKASEDCETMDVVVEGRKVHVDTQIHLYTRNSLIKHPLISPVMSYLGGLPPMLVIVSDKEVLRDEVIYMAHKAAHPDRYPVKEEARKLYPKLEDIESRYHPTKVHLQVYDDTCHVLPMFSFTTPAKFCYRAIATFCKFVTPHRASTTISPPGSPLLTSDFTHTPEIVDSPTSESIAPLSSSPTQDEFGVLSTSQSQPDRRVASRSTGIFRRRSSFVLPLARRSSTIASTARNLPAVSDQERGDSGDVAGRRFATVGHTTVPGTAGDPAVYIPAENADSPFVDNMIRERVSTQGVIRPLEPEDKLQALRKPFDLVGVISEASAKRYLEARVAFDRKFARASKGIERTRSRHLRKAHRESTRVIDEIARATTSALTLGSHSWYLDGDENPPPSSLAARRDTAEARRLGVIADHSLSQEETRMSGNSLWTSLANFLSTTPERDRRKSKVIPTISLQSSSDDDIPSNIPTNTSTKGDEHAGHETSSDSTGSNRRSSIFGVRFFSRKSTIRPSA